MKEIKAKIYYEIATGNILTITSEMAGEVEENTKEQDCTIYPQLQDKDINNIDFIELEYGTFASIFTNIKSYKINLETKALECEYYTAEELQAMQNQEQESQVLTNRVNDISDYLNQQSSDTIADFENYILQNEINKITEGMN